MRPAKRPPPESRAGSHRRQAGGWTRRGVLASHGIILQTCVERHIASSAIRKASPHYVPTDVRAAARGDGVQGRPGCAPGKQVPVHPECHR